jgi:hypothetical protein
MWYVGNVALLRPFGGFGGHGSNPIDSKILQYINHIGQWEASTWQFSLAT